MGPESILGLTGNCFAISMSRMVLDAVPLLLIAAVFVLILFAVGYPVIYRRIMKGTKKLKLSGVVWTLVFVSYAVVLYTVTLRRAEIWHTQTVYPLFYSYKSAWNSFNVTEWRNIILNILMFVPFGFLLPSAFVFFRKFWKTYLAGFVVTLGIECSQLIFALGIFECDDIFNNFLGVMVGYGFYAIVRLVIALAKKRKCSVGKTLALQIPLLGAVVLFSTIFFLYFHKELGNLRLYNITPQTGFEITATQEYGTEPQSAMVYQVEILDRDKADAFAREYFEMLGTSLDETSASYYDETAAYDSMDKRSFWVNFAGKSYIYTDFSVGFGNEEIPANETAAEEEIRTALQKYKVEIPSDAVFDNQGAGYYYFFVTRSLNDGNMQDGVLNCTYYANGVIGRIMNSILTAVPYKEFELISEQEAYKMICDGKIHILFSDDSDKKVVLGDVNISYRMDSKGFYVPIYSFDAVMSDCTTQIEVPAIR